MKSVFQEHMPEYNLDFMKRDWIRSVSATYGDEHQRSHAPIQTNVTIPNNNGNILTKAIGSKGLLHFDPMICLLPTRLSYFGSRSLDPEFF